MLRQPTELFSTPEAHAIEGEVEKYPPAQPGSRGLVQAGRVEKSRKNQKIFNKLNFHPDEIHGPGSFWSGF